MKITVPMLPDARNHTSILCPQCGGAVRDASSGGVPGDVACNACSWQATWIETTGELAGQDGLSTGIYETPTA